MDPSVQPRTRGAGVTRWLLVVMMLSLSAGCMVSKPAPAVRDAVALVGFVMLPDSTRIENAQIRTDPPTSYARSGMDGTFRLTGGLHSGASYRVIAEHDGYPGRPGILTFTYEAGVTDTVIVFLATTRILTVEPVDPAAPGKRPGKVYVGN